MAQIEQAVVPSAAVEGCASAGLAFVAADRVWWFALLAACYRRPPMQLLSTTSFGPRIQKAAESTLGRNRLSWISERLDTMGGRFAKSSPGRSMQQQLDLCPKRLVKVLPQSIALYNICLPVWLPVNGWMATQSLLTIGLL
mmetsp:Transcript_89545/g.187070  ORF Transcript_89545/g.187070 Transcript_89545/m.187070 type:complete len:141 (+) Transcript_89545:220-642(+)